MIKPPAPFLRDKSHCGGFSLVEVTLALAVMGFACVSLMGMIPLGLASFHQAMGNTIEAEIVQNLSNDILLSDFSDLYRYTSSYGNGQTFYYDNEGEPLAPGSGGSAPPARTVYTAVVSLSVVSGVNSPAALTDAGVSTSGTPTPTTIPATSSAYNVTITISNINSPTQAHSYPVIVANNNR